MPRVTVLMAVYNGERYLHEAVKSILTQTFQDFELLVLDDGSTDSSRDIIRMYDDPRIRRLDNAENIGLTRTLNRGIQAAAGALIARQDGDDIAEPDRLARQVAYFDANPRTGLVGTWYRDIDADGVVLGDRQLPCDWVGIRWALLFHCPLTHSTVMFPRAVAERVGMYDERLDYAADHELWCRIARHYPAANLPEYLLRYRVNPWSMTATYGERLLEGPRVSIGEMGRLLGWSDAPDDDAWRMERFRHLETLVLGSTSAIDAERAEETVKELLQLHEVFASDLELPLIEARHRTVTLRRTVGERLVRAASHRARRGEPSHAKRLLRQAWRLSRQSTFSFRGAKTAALLLRRRPPA